MSRNTALTIHIDSTKLSIEVPNGALLDFGFIDAVNVVKQYSGFEAINFINALCTIRKALSLNELVFISNTLDVSLDLCNLDGLDNYQDYKDTWEHERDGISEETLNRQYYVSIVVHS